LCFAILLSGCGSEPPVVPVTGTVHVDGKPTEKVLVNFYPADSSPQHFGVRHAIGITDAQGKFKLICSGGLEGIAAGNYKVTFSRPVIRGRAALTDANAKPEESGTVESMPKNYTHPDTTPVSITIPKVGGDFVLEVKTK
jgi:hypothetical protein